MVNSDCGLDCLNFFLLWKILLKQADSKLYEKGNCKQLPSAFYKTRLVLKLGKQQKLSSQLQIQIQPEIVDCSDNLTVGDQVGPLC